jgi:SnoaL-like domain
MYFVRKRRWYHPYSTCHQFVRCGRRTVTIVFPSLLLSPPFCPGLVKIGQRVIMIFIVGGEFYPARYLNSCYNMNVTPVYPSHLPDQSYVCKEFKMSVEQVARDFFAAWSTGKFADHLTPDAMVSGGVLPQTMPALEAFGLISAIQDAMPDFKITIEKVTAQGDQATVLGRISGTQTSPLSLPMPGMPTVPATGKKVSAPDKFIVTVKGDKVSHMHVDSPADGGIPALLGQLGVKMPGM